MEPTGDLIRPRRLRLSATLRGMIRRVTLRRSDFIAPVFACDGAKVSRPIASMPGISQMSVDIAADHLSRLHEAGIQAYLAFGVIASGLKDATGSVALDENNVVCRLVREMKKRCPAMLAITDLCMCEYTSHGHCGPLTGDQRTVDNERTLPLLAKQALNHAAAGADLVAPSGMMDHCVRHLRQALDAGGFDQTGILSYAVKYASAYYGPFREAAESAPAFGDRRSYQMDAARGLDEAIREATLDVAEGADLVMVKPAGPYLDVLSAVRAVVPVPVVAYQVSGEYSMLESAVTQGLLDRRAVQESLIGIKRAGADLIISYYASLLPPLAGITV